MTDYLPITRVLSLLLAVLISAFNLFSINSCTPSEVYYKRYALYNFDDEGFLAADLVQTIGKSKMPQIEAGLIQRRRLCLNSALDEARDRMVSIFLHTNQDIRASPLATNADENSYITDYPVQFSRRDIMLGTATFRQLLDTAFIALQDSRSEKSCTIVLRIIDDKIIDKINQYRLAYELESVPEKDQNENRNPSTGPAL